MVNDVVSWEKWVDPYSSIVDRDDIQGMPEGERDFHEGGNNTKVIFTSMGIVPITEANTPGKVFNFWTGHTNFNVTPKIRQIIKSIDGVEIFNVLTRYRVRVGVAKLFNEERVKGAIQKAITNHFTKTKERHAKQSRRV